MSVCTQRGRGGKAHLGALSLLNDLLLLNLSAVGLGLALVATLVGLALVDELDGVVAHTLVLVAVLLRVALDGAEGAFVRVAARRGGLAERVQSGAANEGAILCVALDLLNLERSLDVRTCERLLAHE
jgi:hypothetical protein